MRFRALLTVGAISLCGLSPMHAGNGSSKSRNPRAEMAAIRYNTVKGVQQLRTDFTDNQKFVKLLLEAFDEYEKFIMEPGVQDWRPAVKAYHAAFEELKRCLQGEWSRIFGDGPSRFPWNGHSDGATDLWREDDLRRDMPVVLSFWNPLCGWYGHICRTEFSSFAHPIRVPNDNKAYVPNNSPAINQAAINGGKDKYKAYVLKFFNASKLSECGKYLERFLCAPLSRLLKDGALALEKQAVCKEDLKLLLNLYADYYSLDAIGVNVRGHYQHISLTTSEWMKSCDDFVGVTRRMVHLMVVCYLNYKQWKLEDQKWLCSLLDNLDANYYVKENLHTYCIQSHDLLRGYVHTITLQSVNTTSITSIKDEGLMHVFGKLGNVPLPEATWQKFVNYAGRRLSLASETLAHGGIYDPNDAEMILHRRKTFDQVPCAKEVLEEISEQGEAGIKK